MEISLKDALAISSAYELGDKIKFEEAPAEFGRVAAAQSINKTIMEKMRKQTRAITYNKYKEHEMKSCQEQSNVLTIVSSMLILAALKRSCSNKTKFLEKSLLHTTALVFVYKVEDNPRGVNVFVSRSHPEMIKC